MLPDIDKHFFRRMLSLLSKTPVFKGLLFPFPSSLEIFALVLDIKKSQTEFDNQVAEAVTGLHKTSDLVASLEDQLQSRMAKLEQIRADHAKYSELAQIEAGKAAALLKQVELTLGKDQKKERWIALSMHLGVGFLFFVSGVVLSDLLKEWLVKIWTKLFS